MEKTVESSAVLPASSPYLISKQVSNTRMINVSEIDNVTAQARHKQSREAALEEVESSDVSAKSRQRGCRRYVLRQTVPHVCVGDRKSSVANS